MKKTKILTFTFLTVFTVGQFSFINSKNNSFVTKAEENPYMPVDNATTYSGKSFDLVDGYNNYVPGGSGGSGSGSAIAYMQIIDNSSNSYFNHATTLGTTNPLANVKYSTDAGGSGAISPAYFYPSLSNIKKNDTYYMNFGNVSDSIQLVSFMGDGSYALGNETSTAINSWTLWEDVNNENTYSHTQIDHSNPSPYPYLETYDNNPDVFKMGDSSGTTLEFTIEASYLGAGQNIGVTMINTAEDDEYLQYEQYQAVFQGQSGSAYTYQISGLDPEGSYSFYSINYSGLSVGQTDTPDFDILLTDELGVPSGFTMINSTANIDTTAEDVFKITEENDKSIEFALKIIDSDDTYKNQIKNTHTIDVTILNLDTNKTINTEARFKSESGGVFKFEISGLNKGTDYRIISLDNTGLLVDGIEDNNILINQDLHISDDKATGTTTTDIGLIVSMSILAFIVLVIVTLGLIYYFMGENKKAQMKSSLKGYFK